MEYGIARTDEIEVTDLSQQDEPPIDLPIRDVSAALGTDEIRAKLWYFEPGDEVPYHAQTEQEEFYYVVEGEFSIKVGRSGETEIVEAGPGTFYAAGPRIGHGHRYVGDDRGVILAIGAPAVDDDGLDPHAL
jgi:uncharacterized cupin superfamily protein